MLRPGPAAGVYLAAFLQGIAMVSFAAASPVLKERLGFTDAQYGAIFLPQVVLASLGAIAGGSLARRLGLSRLLALGFLASALSQAALAGAERFGHATPFATVLVGTSLMGLGAGLSAAPLNTYPQLFFPARPETAIVSLHTVMGLGLGAGPLLLAAAVGAGNWALFPLGLLVACLAVATFALTAPLSEAHPPLEAQAGPPPATAVALWLFVGAAFLYALAEASFSNWALLYLHEEKRLSPATAAAALSAFWVMLSAGRVLSGLLILRVSAERLWLTLPLVMATAFLLLPGADSAGPALAVFGLAGFGCSSFFPLTVGFASRRFPGHVASVSALVFAGLSLGVGVASFLLGALRSSMPLARLYPLCAVFPAGAFLLALAASGRRPGGR